MGDQVSTVYLVLAVVPLVLLAAILVPLVPRKGVWFRATPNRDQWLVLGMFAFSILVAAFGVRKIAFGAFMAFAGAAVLFQSWGPKRWHGGRVWGAYFVPLKVKGWRDEGDFVAVRLGWGCRLRVDRHAVNRAFLDELETISDSGKGME